MDEKTMERIALSVLSKIDSVKNVRNFMIADLEKTIALKDTPKGAPNFMLALALCAYTEYWGRFIEGKVHGDSEVCFKAFFKKLGKCYEELLNRSELNIYHDVRCGLAHAYMIERNSTIYVRKGTCGVEYDSSKKAYTFNVMTYFENFKQAVDQYIEDLEAGKEDFTKFMCALSGKPTLI